MALALAAGVAPAVAVGKATSSPAFAAPATTEPALPEPAAEPIETACTRGGTSCRADRSAMSTEPRPQDSGRALLGWTRFGSPGIFG
ncbi:hypothetical protein ACIRSS_02715 [Amycolatopsis sp. NPDC101161]|uniref:hypothetical protein n=1 Tax=Amycolatopsis sp. NPDC101161 TaxID=3363940 RepID=UPI00382099D9